MSRRAELWVHDARGLRVVGLDGRMISVGRAADNDVRLDGNGVADRHLHILRDGDGYRLFTSDGHEARVNGRKRAEHRLGDGDHIHLGEVHLEYRFGEAVDSDPAPPEPERGDPTIGDSVPLEAFKRLYRFSAHIAGSPDVETLERKLVDAVIELAGADTGILLADFDGKVEVEMARAKEGRDLDPREVEYSASMVREVLDARRALLVRDALDDDVFAERRSVVDYRLRSVVAVPIVLGDITLGVLYLGCDRKAAFTPVSLEILSVFAAQAGLLLRSAQLVDRLQTRNQALEAELERRRYGEIIGDCASMQEVFRTVSRVAPTEITVLVLGETGTGKELIAREVHRRSRRADGPFVALNMAAIPENLLEAELFGHVRGAFTGAVDNRRGKIAEANGGTLFLDEIGDLPLALQAKLLRVLQERSVTRVGSNTSEALDIRVVAATHQPLESLRDQGRFREDLFYRLDEVQVLLPPLRERGDDVELLAHWFLKAHAREALRFSAAALAAMKRYAWRGNVRELEARVKKASILAEGPALEPADLGFTEAQLEPILPLKEAKERFATGYVKDVLSINKGNRSQTARDLAVDPRTIYKYVEGK